MQVEPIDLCFTQPYKYKTCSNSVCILRESICHEETHTVIVATTPPASRIGTPSGEDGLSLPVVVTIASVCVFFCVLLVMFLYIYIIRRQENDTSRESQSAAQPLRKSYITSYPAVEATLMQPPSLTTNHKHEPTEARDYIQLHSKCNHDTEGIDNDKHSPSIDNEPNMFRQNLAINDGSEIYDSDTHDAPRPNGLGRYTFKPRLKYLTSKPYFEIAEKDREKLYVINSYKHCAGKSILPSTLTFDTDPEQFSNKFATDLLCSSTPRQAARYLEKNEESLPQDDITVDDENDIDP